MADNTGRCDFTGHKHDIRMLELHRQPKLLDTLILFLSTDVMNCIVNVPQVLPHLQLQWYIKYVTG